MKTSKKSTRSESPAINANMKKAIAKSHYKNTAKLAEAMAKTFQPKNL